MADEAIMAIPLTIKPSSKLQRVMPSRHTPLFFVDWHLRSGALPGSGLIGCEVVDR